ncbi:hypothetical protein [Clostridium frigidicarnis]|uniref:Uncharacterized protein n=1 Tax=Clostridium frigidicarnis TaxID=84698 RepID=A0A1I0W6N3_9CLOT|nr:hypothetical protein [Clostridium frigidicarnis]SFA83977.1 hypothetical protein SAMN04488528_100465 [Clostridium frigidicarnis]
MKSFFDLSYEEIVCLATSIGLGIAGELTVYQQNILANFYILLGQVIVVANTVGGVYPPVGNGPNYGPVGLGSLTGCRFGCKDNSNNNSSNNDDELQKNLKIMMEKINDLEREISILNQKNND